MRLLHMLLAHVTSSFPTSSVLLVPLFLFTPLMSGINACNSDDADGDGWTVEQGDCDDSNSSTHPGAPEQCNTVDDDCDEQIDETTPYYRDADGDGFGDASAVVMTCTKPSGFTTSSEDCNDSDAAIYPAASERCNALDDDCDGSQDEDYFSRYYRDTDGDGFGLETQVKCSPTTGYASARGDCDDARTDTYPGAVDSLGDARDQDCGGTDGAQPHVGLNSRSATSLQLALSSASTNAVVWVGAGTYTVSALSFPAHDLRLRSTHGAAATRLDAQQKGRILTLTSNQALATLIDGFTFENGYRYAENGGAVQLSDASVTFRDCIFSNNIAEAPPEAYVALGFGGAVAVSGGSVSFLGCLFQGNRAYTGTTEPTCDSTGYCYTLNGGGHGGALYTLNAEVTIGGSRFIDNASESGEQAYGGGAYLEQSKSEVVGTQFTNNRATSGAGLYQIYGEARIGYCLFRKNTSTALNVIRANSTVVQDTVIEDNIATSFQSQCGGGMGAGLSNILVERTQFLRNTAHLCGGGLALGDIEDQTVIIRNSVFTRNWSKELGGALSIGYGPAIFDQLTFVDNAARSGVVYMSYNCAATLTNSLFVNNPGYQVYSRIQEAAACPSNIAYNHFDIPYGTLHNFSAYDTTLDADTITEGPVQFLVHSFDSDPANDDYHLLPEDALRNAGTPGSVDADGTAAELGAYGGLSAHSNPEKRYYTDADQDQLYDGWESRFGSNPALSDAGLDTDGDGLSTWTEFNASLDPRRADTDQDGTSDGAEISAGSDPLDWYSQAVSQRSEAGGKVLSVTHVTAQVPGDFPDLQSAGDAIRSVGSIALAPGLYDETLFLINKDVTLEGAGLDETTISPTDTGFLNFYGGKLFLSDLTLYEAGYDPTTGEVCTPGARIVYSNATLQDVTMEQGACAGFYAQLSTVTAARIRVDSRRSGSPFDLDTSHMVGTDLVITNGRTSAFWLFPGSTLDLTNSILKGNRYGAIHAEVETFVKVSHSLIEGNSASDIGGAVNLLSNADRLTGEFSYVHFINNTSGYRGGAVYQLFASATFDHCLFVGNSDAKGWGALTVSGTAATTAKVTNSLFAYNTGYNVYADNGSDTPNDALPNLRLDNSVLYSLPGQPNYLLPPTGYGTSNLIVEPGFLRYDAQGVPSDYHLAAISPLINAGTSSTQDPDGSPADIGATGGAGAASFDLDFDGRPDYFWPGGYSAVPTGILGGDYDPDDRDPLQ